MKTSVVRAAIAAVCAAAALSAFGAGVSGDDAKGAVTGWVRLREALGDEIDAEPESVATYQGRDGVGEFHVVSLVGGGYVITSGDTELTPILGYSKTGTFDADENSPIWALLTADVAARAAALEGTSGQATGGRRLSSSGGSSSGSTAQDTDSPASAWSRLMAAGQSGGKRLQAKMSSTPTDLRVASFVQSKWSQQTANGRKYYNYYTPNNWPCGCVATAQAQTMRYFEFPKASVTAKTFTCSVNGTDTDLTMQGGTYDWTHMPYVPATATYAETNMLSIAKLTSDVGISLCMKYKSGGSGTSSLYVGDSLVSTFGYSNAVADYEGGGVKGNTFKKNVIPSLDAKLPVVLGIQGRPTGSVTADAGHSILTDGYGYYNNQLYIHLNFGWSGSDDAWYTPADSDTGAIINASDYNFTNITCTVFNIFTNATQYSVIASGRVLDQNGAAISGATVTAKYNNTTYATATSDARGVYALILPPTSSTRTYTVNATHSEYTSVGALSVRASQTQGDYPVKSGNNYSGGYYIAASNSNSYDNDITMESLGLPKLATPESPTATAFGTSASVTLTCATNGATIYYTIDGSTPTTSSTLYTGPIVITNTTTVKARAFKSGYARSDVFTRTFVSAATIDECYFRYDFSDGTRQFIGSASQASDPLTADAGAANFVAACGQDGSNTAVHVKSNAYGTDKIGGSSAAGKAVLAGDWTLAMSVRPGSVEKGLLFSLGRANDNNSKCVFLASSSTAGKIYVGTARKKGSANSYTGSVDRELAQEWGLTGASADTTSGYHSIVAVHSSGGTVAVYVDGELAGSVDTTENASGCVFGNGIQFNQAHGSSTFLSANGYSQSLNNPDVAFQDVRFYDFAFTAENAAAYAALYPATLPGFSNLDQYAYVQSYGVNGVDTGVYMTDTDKFTADFAFTDASYKSWLCGAGKNANKQTHAIYLNGNQQLAWTTRGEWWWSTWPSAKIEGSTIEDTRLVMTVESSLTANLTYYDTRETKSSDASSKTATSTGPSIIPTHLFRANSMVEEAGQECKAKIYSFEVDADSSAITPRAFFAPTTDGNGAAGFTNVVAGTFHGECLSNPSPALTFTSGVGRAEDYRYRSGKFYSRIYARSADSATGLVKFDGGEAAGTNAQYTTRGRTAKIVAVPAEYYVIDRWEGDTWAITEGSVNDATIEVKSDTAIQLRAVFKYVRVSTPALGEGFTALFNGSATFALSCATEGASIYYTTNGTTPTVSSTLYEGTFSFNSESMFTMLKAIAVKDGWYDSDVFEVKLANLAVAPKSAYAQVGSESLLLHLDAIENAGAGTHSDSLATWADLAGNHTVTETGSAGFQADAWTANGSSCFLTTSTAAKDALAAKAFTLELVISHPSTQNQYENWVFIGQNNDHRQLSVDLRNNNSKNPLVQGVQYRESSWNGTRSSVPNKNGTATKWNTRQYIAVVCDADGATTYYDGMNVLHTNVGGGVDPTTTEVSIGASFNGGNMLYNGSEICAVRMTGRALTEDERMRNFYVDSQRFGLEGAPSGYCIANGNVKVRITEGVEGFEFSTDGGTTWMSGEVWVDINTAVTLSARVAASTDMHVNFKNLPEGATTSGNSVTFTPTKPCAITVSAAQWTNHDGTGSFDNVANWIGGVPPAAADDFTVNISGDTVITVNETYSLGAMTVKGTGNVTFTGTGSISATMLNVASNLTVDTCGKLTVTGVAGAGNVVLTPASDTLAISSASTLTGDLTIKADSSVAFNMNAATSVSNFYVCAATNAVVTITVSSGESFISTETIVKSGVLKQGSATALGNTPKVTVENGGTFDVNGLAPSRSTTFCIAGAGAGDWPWALTSSVNVSDDKKSIDIVNLADDATIGGNVQICIGVRGGATFNATTQTLPLTLNGHTLTKTGTGTLWFRRPYSTNEGMIDVQSGTLRVNGWSNANAAYGQSCVSNIALVVHEGATAKNELSYVLYFKTLDLCGGALTSSSGAFGMSTGETLSGHGTAAKLTMANGAVATLDGDLSVTTTLTADGALSLVRKTGVETNVTVAVTGTLTASGAITVGAGVIFDIGANRPTVTLTVDDGATLVLRRATDVERNVVLNVTANPQNIVVYDTDGTTEIADPPVTYDSDAGTVTIRVFTPRWTNNDGTGSFDSAANWASGVLPLADEDFIVNISSDTVIAATNTYNLGGMTVKGTGSVAFTGDGSISATMLNVASNLTVDTSGKLTVPGFAGSGNVVLTPASDTLAISSASTLTGNLTVKTDSSVAFNVNAATSVSNFYVRAATNAVVTLTVGSGGSFKATAEAIVQHGVLKQGSATALGTTPKITVQDGGTFDINGKTIRQETPIYIAGAGAGDWPWALATSSAMASGNYLYDLYLTADATIGKGQFKLGRSNQNSFIYLNGHTLTAKSWLTLRCINTMEGTIDLQNSATVNAYNNLNRQTAYRGTTLIVHEGYTVFNKTDREVDISYLRMYGGTIGYDGTARDFGVWNELHGYGEIKRLVMGSGAKYYPDGAHHLEVTEKLEGTVTVDLSDINFTNRTAPVPLLKVPTSLADTARSSLSLTAPKGWELKEKVDGDETVHFTLRKSKGVIILVH